MNPNKLRDPFAEADRLVAEAFADNSAWAQEMMREAMDSDARYERAEQYHVWREEGGPTDDDFDMPDDEPAEDMG